MEKCDIMWVNKYIMSLFMLGVLIIFSACQDLIVPDNRGSTDGEGADLVPITLDLKDIFGNATYSLTMGPDVGGTAAEDLIADVTVYIFKASDGSCEKILEGTGSSLPIGPVLITTGVKNFVAVANVVGNVTGLPTSGQESAMDFATILRKISDRKTTFPESPFLMTGTKLYVNVLKQTAPGSQVLPVTIDVSRTVSKVTLHFTKSGRAASKNIVVQKLTFFNGADRVGLFETPNPNPAQYDVKQQYNAFTNTGDIPCMALDTFYTYENLAGRMKSRASYFEVEALVGGSIVRSCKVYPAEYPGSGMASDTLWDLKRNYWYDVHLDIIDPGLDSVYVTVNVSKWNVADPQEVISGAGYEIVEMAVPFKLVKYYTGADTVLKRDIAAIHKHSKGASWFRLQVSNNVPWKLDFKPPLTGGERFSIDSGVTWHYSLSDMKGDDNPHLIYVYRPYIERGEPDYGPSFTLTVAGQEVRDFVVQPRDSLPVPTNSYILRPQLPGTPANETRVYIPLKEVYRYWEDCIYPNGDSIPSPVAQQDIKAELLWQDRASGDVVVRNLNLVNANRRDRAYIYAEAGPVQGNAVIAFKVNGYIYWSFHLWVTEYNPYETAGQNFYLPSGKTKGNIFMDRNLGALNNQYDSRGDARGLFYQFGRSVPLPAGADWTNKFLYTATSFGDSITSDVLPGAVSPYTLPPYDALPYSLRRPMVIFTNDQSWPLSDENPCLWNTKEGYKTAFDPCPEGWRVPKQEQGPANSPWYGLDNAGFPESPAGYTNGRYHPSVGYYPFSGYIDGGSLTGSSVKACYRSSYSGASINGTGLEIGQGSVVNFVPDIPKSRGASIRCVVDANYLQNMPSGGLFGDKASQMKEKIMP
jgi:hypothetical protein